MEKEITCTLEKNSFMGYYFIGTKETSKAIISVNASSCDEKTSIAMADYLRKAGYNVLVLGYYHWKGLAKHLSNIPLDYALKAVEWLKEQGIQHIAMTGVSEGACYALCCATRIKEITCVIPVVPYDHLLEATSGGTKRLFTSPFSYQGKEIPYTPFTLLDQGAYTCYRKAKKEGFGFSHFLRWCYDQQEKNLNPESRIKVENMNAEVLFLAVMDDDCWPSDIAVPRMVKVLKQNNYPHRVESYIYETASHALMDGISSMSAFDRYFLKKMFFMEKKYPTECEEARKDSFHRILTFLEEWKG